MQVKLIGAHLFGTTVTNQDVDGTSSGPGANLNLLRNTTHKQDSAEFQISGEAFGDRLNYVTGVYYLRENAYQPTLNVVSNVRQRLYVNNEAKAAYGHADLKLTDGLQIGAGVRYTSDDKGLRYGSFNETTRACVPLSAVIQTAAGSAYDPATCQVTLENNSRYWSYDVSANYQVTPDIFIYARTGKGQKSGGFNSAVTSVGDLTAYRPEIAQDYELGFKSQWFDHRVRFNVAVYQTDYRDIQRAANVSLILPTTPPTTTTAIVVSNAAKARIRGMEAELNVKLGGGFEVGANYSYIDPTYLSFTSVSSTGAIIDQSSFPFQYVSRHQGRANISYDNDVRGLGRLRANIDYAYRSRYSNYTSPDPATEQRGFSLVNARAGISPEGLPNVDIGLWVKNLFDKEYWTGSSFSSAVHFALPGRPRMFGADVKIRFGQ